MKPLGSWNLVNPLLSMNEAWIDEYAARLQPLVDQYKTQTTPNFCNRKIPDHVLGTKKSILKMFFLRNQIKSHKYSYHVFFYALHKLKY